MLKVRYNIETGLLSGWTDDEDIFPHLIARRGEAVAVLDIAKPDADDYEYFIYSEGTLFASGKTPPQPKPEGFIRSNPLNDPPSRINHVEDFLEGRFPL